METTNPEVLDISSDDEDDGLGERGDWLAYLLEKEDSDEVVVVGEVAGSSVWQEQSSKSSIKEDEDDDCLILDGDPDKPDEVANDTVNGSTDELQIVSAKGQVACRDYPHPRHLCATYPFSTNPHEKYCDLCHCYVCDTLAPCNYWGTGVSGNDHCHSSDKEEVWRVHRKLTRQGKTAPLPLPPPVLAPKHPGNIFSTQQHPIHNNSTTQVHANSNTLRACSTANNNGVPYQRNQQWGEFLVRNRLPHSGVTSSPSVNNTIRRDKGSSATTLGPRFVSPRVHFKRVGSGVSVTTKSRSVHGSYEYNYTSQQQQQWNLQNEMLRRSQELKTLQKLNHHTELNACQSASQPIIGGGFMEAQSYNDILMQSQVYTRPLPQPVENQVTTYLAEDPAAPTSFSGTDLNWVDDRVESLPPSVSTVPPASEPSPVIEPVPQCPDVTSADFDLESWIQSLEYRADFEIGKETLGFVPTQAELAEAAVRMFDFENL